MSSPRERTHPSRFGLRLEEVGASSADHHVGHEVSLRSGCRKPRFSRSRPAADGDRCDRLATGLRPAESRVRPMTTSTPPHPGPATAQAVPASPLAAAFLLGSGGVLAPRIPRRRWKGLRLWRLKARAGADAELREARKRRRRRDDQLWPRGVSDAEWRALSLAAMWGINLGPTVMADCFPEGRDRR